MSLVALYYARLIRKIFRGQSTKQTIGQSKASPWHKIDHVAIEHDTKIKLKENVDEALKDPSAPVFGRVHCSNLVEYIK